MKFIIKFGAECCTLLPSEGVGVLVRSARASSLHPSGIALANANHKQFARATAASKHSVIPPAVSGEVNGLVRSTGTSAVQCAIIRATGQCLIWRDAYAPVEWQTRKRKAMARLADRQAQDVKSLIVTAEGRRVSGGNSNE